MKNVFRSIALGNIITVIQHRIIVKIKERERERERERRRRRKRE